MKKVKQPQIVPSTVQKIRKYSTYVEKFGYKPWVNVRQSHTYGQGQEFISHKTSRIHSLLSRGERPTFFYLERDPTVVEIFDQYPLPLNETLALAAKLNIVHPGIYKERKNHGGIIPAAVMTTDFLVKKRFADGKQKLVAYSFKYSSALNPDEKHPRSVARTKQKLRLEEEFWRSQDVEFILEDENTYDPNLIYNLEFLRQCYHHPAQINVSEDLYTAVLRELKWQLPTFSGLTLKQILESVARKINLDLHQALCLFQKAVYEFQLPIDLTVPLELYHPVSMIEEE